MERRSGSDERRGARRLGRGHRASRRRRCGVTRDQTRTAQLIFREINERVAEITVQYHESESEFVCECGRDDCTAHVELNLDEYQTIRASGEYFIAALVYCVEAADGVSAFWLGFDVGLQLGDRSRIYR